MNRSMPASSTASPRLQRPQIKTLAVKETNDRFFGSVQHSDPVADFPAWRTCSSHSVSPMGQEFDLIGLQLLLAAS